MIPEQLNARILRFCRQLRSEDLPGIPFRKPILEGVPNAWLAEQAALIQLAAGKLPDWAEMENVVYPDRQALEQCSSHLVARWKKSLLPSGVDVLADASAGLGVDAFTLGEGIRRLLVIEPDLKRAFALRYNSDSLRKGDMEVRESPLSEKELTELAVSGSRFLLYADPDRRSEEGKRKFHWTDCLPDVRIFYRILKDQGCRMMVKFSPLDDPEEINAALPGARAVYVVSVHNEVKEVLILWDFSSPGETVFHSVDLRRSGEVEEVLIPVHLAGRPDPGEIRSGHYLLDPRAGLRKGRFADCLAEAMGWKQVSTSARLYLSEAIPAGFPGRIFQILQEYPSPSSFRKEFAGNSCHLVARDFPVSSEDLRKKLKLREEGSDYLFCIRDDKGFRRVIHAKRC